MYYIQPMSCHTPDKTLSSLATQLKCVIGTQVYRAYSHWTWPTNYDRWWYYELKEHVRRWVVVVGRPPVMRAPYGATSTYVYVCVTDKDLKHGAESHLFPMDLPGMSVDTVGMWQPHTWLDHTPSLLYNTTPSPYSSVPVSIYNKNSQISGESVRIMLRVDKPFDGPRGRHWDGVLT